VRFNKKKDVKMVWKSLWLVLFGLSISYAQNVVTSEKQAVAQLMTASNLMNEGKFRDGIPLLKGSIEFFKFQSYSKNNYTYLLAGYGTLGSIYSQLELPEEELKIAKECFEQVELKKLGDEGLSTCYSLEVMAYEDSEQYQKAIDSQIKWLDMSNDVTFHSYVDLSTMFLKINQKDKANFYINKAIKRVRPKEDTDNMEKELDMNRIASLPAMTQYYFYNYLLEREKMNKNYTLALKIGNLALANVKKVYGQHASQLILYIENRISEVSEKIEESKNDK
jgi:tetratricopeptide (TPR) repeat protein